MTYSTGFSTLSVLAALAGAWLIWYAAKRRTYVPVFLFLCVCIAALPQHLGYLNLGHDITFHLNRILGIKESLMQGMFPVRLNGFTFQGYGYADALCYPNLFLYIPAVLAALGLPLVTSVNIFLFLVHAATAAVMYLCAKKLFHKTGTAAVCSALYTLCIYRLCDAYTRAAYGEMLAMIFFPVVILGVYEIFFGDEKNWHLLALGVTGIFQSNLVSLVLTVSLCVFFGVLYIRNLMEKKRLLALCTAAGMTLLLNVWFWLPLLETLGTGVDTSSLAVNADEKIISIARLFDAFPSADDGRNLGLSLLAGLAVFLYAKVKHIRTDGRKAEVFVLTGSVLAVLCTDLFPWKLMMQIDAIAYVMQYIQFPWRILGPAVCFLCLGISDYCWNLSARKEVRTAVCAGVLFCAVLSAQYFISSFDARSPYISGEADVKNIIVQREYLYSGTDKDSLDGQVREGDTVVVDSFDKDGLSVTVSYHTLAEGGDNTLEIPLFAYPGYQATDAHGTVLSISKGENNCICVQVPSGENTVTVTFQSRPLWRASEAVSALSFAALLWYWRKKYKTVFPKNRAD